MAKAISFRRSQVAGPPKDGEPWVWHRVTLLRSMAWRDRSINLVRLLEFLEIEHLVHAGSENGNLLAPYEQLVRFGIRRESIPAAIKEGERLGLLRVERGRHDLETGRQQESKYLLTYLPERHIVEDVAEWHAPRDIWRKYRRAGSDKKRKPGAGSGTD